MKQKRGIGFIAAVVSFLVATAAFATDEGTSDYSVMKKEKDGSVSKDEFMKHHQWMFEQNDANKDGYLDTNEMKNLHKMVNKMHAHAEHK